MPRRKEQKDDSERWMISYADLLTLLLAFFIVMYAKSEVNKAKLKSVAAGMVQAFHGNPATLMRTGHGGSGLLKHAPSAIQPPRPTDTSSARTTREIALKTQALKRAEAALRKVLHPLLESQQVKLSERPLSLRIRLNAEILYPSAQAKLMPKAHAVLSQIAGVLVKIPHDYPIVIQGYTNNRPIRSAQFPSNWELSTARALSVLRLFMKQGFPGSQLSAQGFGKFHPIASNNTARGLRINRRVEIVIKSPAARMLEMHAKASSIPAASKAMSAADARSDDRSASSGTAKAVEARAGGNAATQGSSSHGE